jgi:hypothetical protein
VPDDYGMSLVCLTNGSNLIAGFGRGLPRWKIYGSGNVPWEQRLESSSMYAAGRVIELGDGGFRVSGLEVIVGH